jgi:hypothetical protein
MDPVLIPSLFAVLIITLVGFMYSTGSPGSNLAHPDDLIENSVFQLPSAANTLSDETIKSAMILAAIVFYGLLLTWFNLYRRYLNNSAYIGLFIVGVMMCAIVWYYNGSTTVDPTTLLVGCVGIFAVAGVQVNKV